MKKEANRSFQAAQRPHNTAHEADNDAQLAAIAHVTEEALHPKEEAILHEIPGKAADLHSKSLLFHLGTQPNGHSRL